AAIDPTTGAWTFTPTDSNWIGSDNFTVTVTDDLGGTTAQVVNVTLANVNDAPVLTGDLTATVNEGATYTITGTDLGYSDPDDLDAGTTFTTSSASNGKIQVNGVDATSFTGTQLTAGLVTFIHDGSETVAASFDVNVEDGNEDVSTPANSTFNFTVTPVNDTPVVTAPGSDLAATEQAGLALHGQGFGVSDVDEAGAGATATLSVGEGTVSVVIGDSGLMISSGNGTGTVIVSGTIAQIDALLTGASTGTITYLNGSDTPSASTVFSVAVNDGGNTGIDPGLTADGTSEEGTSSVTINVAATNDDPTNAGALPTDIAVTEDVSSNIDLSAVDLSDVDAAGGSLTVTLTTSTGGDLSAAAGTGITMGGTSTALTLTGSVTDLNTYLDTASNITYLHGTPHANGNDADTINIKVNDNGNTGIGGGTDIDLGSVNVDITAENDLPTAANNTVVTNEDTAYTFTASDFSFSDIDGDTLASIEITSLESAGALQLSGVDVTLNQVISKADIDAGKLKFVPATNANGMGYDAFDFSVNDGVIDSFSTYTITLDVTAINDLPIATSDVAHVDEGSSVLIDLAGNDLDAEGALDVTSITITGSPLNGTLVDNGDG
ncbi:MAG: hypothetical protein GY708_05510, partial [Actinomycetia bacterium]|nr:hypothetical protein [Actinomycetes bacterium]